jgi:hypothetical protein
MVFRKVNYEMFPVRNSLRLLSMTRYLMSLFHVVRDEGPVCVGEAARSRWCSGHLLIDRFQVEMAANCNARRHHAPRAHDDAVPVHASCWMDHGVGHQLPFRWRSGSGIQKKENPDWLWKPQCCEGSQPTTVSLGNFVGPGNHLIPWFILSPSILKYKISYPKNSIE